MNDIPTMSQFATELDCLRAREAYLLAKVEELQRQNALLVKAGKDVLLILDQFKYESDEDSGSNSIFEARMNEDGFFIAKNDLEKALSATSSQSAAWLEASHIEWMKGLEPVGIFMNHDGNFEKIADECIGMPNLGETIPLYAIPTKKD